MLYLSPDGEDCDDGHALAGAKLGGDLRPYLLLSSQHLRSPQFHSGLGMAIIAPLAIRRQGVDIKCRELSNKYNWF